ncbi:hypothetical protein [Botrimarina mediterranea]|uniref:hypothetical protein n=1 Tax=Botrimarina mediterranea TaxID=2528022 RepID=UPI00118C184B|nr:hypothetical protein K2D_16550 [Planctomycetes bacterium K2D]
MQELTIEIPLPMPTWNRMLAMHPWERKNLRDFLHHAVSLSLTYGSDWPTVTEYRGKRWSMELWLASYYQTIRPNTSRKQLIAKLRATEKQRLSN